MIKFNLFKSAKRRIYEICNVYYVKFTITCFSLTYIHSDIYKRKAFCNLLWFSIIYY